MPTPTENILPKLVVALVLVALAGLGVAATIRYYAVVEALSRSDGYSSPAEPSNLPTAHTADSIPSGDRF
jgi:hypothetical protein